jgi:hypothetical protein
MIEPAPDICQAPVVSVIDSESRPDPVPDRPASGELPTLPARNIPENAAAKPLTPEEQMAAFEKDLKENDWGHQPC